jgi:hypothetical protein
MKKQLLLFVFISAILLPYCTTTRKTMADQKVPAYTYTKDIAPVMRERCTPCHFPDGGKKKFLDTYSATTANVDDILYRIQLPQDSARFMPWKLKKPALSDSLVQVFKTWRETGMRE